VNYKTDDVATVLRRACPDGIDLYFDNVGGELLDICLGQIAMRGRVVLCGAISSYNARGKIEGPRNYRNLIPRRGRMEGFIILDYLDRFPEAQAEMAGWVAEGKVKFATHLVEGLEQAPSALNLAVHRR
jgi:NADPH-dependent curcumin reductase CurA